MLGLPRDVIGHRRALRGAHGESAVTFLPGEIPRADLFVNPSRRDRLCIANDIREAMRGLQPEEKVDVIVHATGIRNGSVSSATSTRKPRRSLTCT